jgi:hypothetical protein
VGDQQPAEERGAGPRCVGTLEPTEHDPRVRASGGRQGLDRPREEQLTG